MPNLNDESRRSLGTGGEKPSLDQLNTGCLQRIANATELMAQNHRRLIEDAQRYERNWKEKRAECERMGKVINGLRGQVAKLLARARKAEAELKAVCNA